MFDISQLIWLFYPKIEFPANDSLLCYIQFKGIVLGYNHIQRLWKNVEKSSKIEQDEKTLISAFALFLTTSTKALFLERSLGTRFCFHLF